MLVVFGAVNWVPWLLMMTGYCLFYFSIDTLIITRALNWFIKDIKYTDILPIRASAYIISMFNEQIGKGAMAYYLNRRDQVPGWEVTSLMLFIMFCEIFYLLIWATIGFMVGGQDLPEVFGLIEYFAIGGAIFFALWVFFFRGPLFRNNKIRNLEIFHAFKLAKLKHYGAFFLLRSPLLIAAVFVYSAALGFFGVAVSSMTLLPLLPVIFFAATIPTPMRAAAITSWIILFPENEGAMAAFGFLQHNFFILFNAIIGLMFLPRANKDLFGTKSN
tara:strand:+ start:375 stop:1196 length:822 start_codon:yes stop_codon:yes gene_type:complete